MTNPAPHRWDYTQADLVDALRRAGVRHGDVVFVHVSVGRLGYPERGCTMADATATAFEALREAVGADGTVMVPTYTYSIGKRQPYDVDATPSTVGDFTEWFRKQPGAVRSADPMLSVAAIGPEASALLSNLPHDCYGPESLYARLDARRAKIVTLGLGLHWATYRHYVEQAAGVPFRFVKLFRGVVVERGASRRETWAYSAAPMVPNCAPNGVPLEERVLRDGHAQMVSVGRGAVTVIDASVYREAGVAALRERPWLSAKGPALSLDALIALDDARVGVAPRALSLAPDCDPATVTAALRQLRRDPVSAGTDAAVAALTAAAGGSVLRWPSGAPCGQTVVPERWTVHEAAITHEDGTAVAPLEAAARCVAYRSFSFEGTLALESLRARLIAPVDNGGVAECPSELDWAMTLSSEHAAALRPGNYQVKLRTTVNFAAIPAGECALGADDPTAPLLIAYAGDCAAWGDGAEDAAVALQAWRELRARGASARMVVVTSPMGLACWDQARGGALRPRARHRAARTAGATFDAAVARTVAALSGTSA